MKLLNLGAKRNNMGISYALGNKHTLEYIYLGKGSFWLKLWEDVSEQNIKQGWIKQYIKENWEIQNVPDWYINYVAENVEYFYLISDNNDLVFKSDDWIYDFGEKLPILVDNMSGKLFIWEGICSQWKQVWDRHTDVKLSYVWDTASHHRKLHYQLRDAIHEVIRTRMNKILNDKEPCDNKSCINNAKTICERCGRINAKDQAIITNYNWELKKIQMISKLGDY
jgi:hypothetical protein